MHPRRTALALTLAAIPLAGCVERTITIDSNPRGALVWLNDREVGRTPLDVDFVFYGTYDVRLELDGYEPLMTSGEARPPLWDVIGLDLAAELLPIPLHSRVHWTYDLTPSDDDPDALRSRAEALRTRLGEDAPAPSDAAPAPGDSSQ